MLKYKKTLRHVSISTDHHQGVCLYLVKVTELFKKNTEFKILNIIPGDVAAKRVAGIRGDPCGAVRYTCYTFCCHNTGNDIQDFKFSVF